MMLDTVLRSDIVNILVTLYVARIDPQWQAAIGAVATALGIREQLRRELEELGKEGT